MRLNITLPDSLAEELKEKPDKSAYIIKFVAEVSSSSIKRSVPTSNASMIFATCEVLPL